MSSWDEKGTARIQHALETEIVSFVKAVKVVSAAKGGLHVVLYIR